MVSNIFTGSPRSGGRGGKSALFFTAKPTKSKSDTRGRGRRFQKPLFFSLFLKILRTVFRFSGRAFSFSAAGRKSNKGH